MKFFGIKFSTLSWLSPGSRVVNYSTHNPYTNSSNPTTSTGREKMAKKVFNSKLVVTRDTVVEYSTHNH